MFFANCEGEFLIFPTGIWPKNLQNEKEEERGKILVFASVFFIFFGVAGGTYAIGVKVSNATITTFLCLPDQGPDFQSRHRS